MSLLLLAGCGSRTDLGGLVAGADAEDAGAGRGAGRDAPADAWRVEAAGFDAGRDGGSDGTVDASVDAGAYLVPDFAWYILNETSGATAHDSSGNHYDVTNLDGVAWSDGAWFDSSAGVCGSVAVGAAFRQPPLTITAWETPEARSDSTSNTSCYVPFPSNAVSGDIPGAGGYALGANVWTDGVPGSGLTVETGTLGCIFATFGSFIAGVPHFVAMTLTDSTATAYMDSFVIGSTPAAPPPAASETVLQLGCVNSDPSWGSRGFYNGHIRDVRVYTRVLSTIELASLVARGPALGP
jgi:hypothetical protein